MKRISRRDFALMSAGFAGMAVPALGQEGKKDGKKDDAKPGKVAAGNAGPVEAAFERDGLNLWLIGRAVAGQGIKVST